VVDSATRTLLGSSVLSGTFEHVQYWWMPLIVFGALALAEKQNEHIVAPVIYDRLSVRSKRVWLVVGNLLTVALAGVLAWYGWFSAVDAMQLGESRGATNVPIWPLRFWIVLGSVLYGAAVVVSTRRQLAYLDVWEDAPAQGPATGASL
jgi:TRAP-type C4-dicarboxylate transport system permease small subunit